MKYPTKSKSRLIHRLYNISDTTYYIWAFSNILFVLFLSGLVCYEGEPCNSTATTIAWWIAGINGTLCIHFGIGE